MGFLLRPRVPAVALLLLLRAALAPAHAHADDARACYALAQAHDADAFEPVRYLPFADAFGSGTVNVSRPKTLCAPAVIDGEPAAEPDTFLESYEVRGRQDVANGRSRRDVAVVDRFGLQLLDLGMIDRFMTPTGFDALTPLTGLPATALGPFTCRHIDTQAPPRTVESADAFADGALRVLEPRRLCSGTDGGAPVFLLCYAARALRPPRPQRDIHTRTVFGPARRDRGRARELCIPAAVGALPTTTTTRPPASTTTTTAPPPTSTTVTTTSTTTTTRPPTGTLRVPGDYPTIQAAVDAAGPNTTILVAAGEYVEGVRITGARDGLTIAGADPAAPPTIRGTPNRSLDGIRVDAVDDVTFRHLRIVGTYDAVRLNGVRGAVLADLYLENSALAIRVNGGAANTIARVTIVGTRVEQGVEMVDAPGSVIVDTRVTGSYREGIRVMNSDDVRLARNTVTSPRSNGIELSDVPRAVVRGNLVRDAYNHGFRIDDADDLVLEDNRAQGSRSVGIRLEQTPPFATVAEVLAAGNAGSGNGSADVVVRP